MLRQGIVLKVDEFGVEAAAVTSVIIEPTSQPIVNVNFHVDQPFACFLYDSQLRIPLLATRVIHPKEL